jgi:hypothetical protein
VLFLSRLSKFSCNVCVGVGLGVCEEGRGGGGVIAGISLDGIAILRDAAERTVDLEVSSSAPSRLCKVQVLGNFCFDRPEI